MKLKKNWFSFVIWAVLSIMSGTYLAVNVIYVADSLGFHNNDTLIAFVCLSLVFCFAFYELLSSVVRGFFRMQFLSEVARRHLFRVIVVSIFVGSYLIRFSHLSQTHFWLNNSDRLYSMAYYYGRPSMTYKSIIEVLYVDLMNLAFTLFGKNTTIALLFQFVLEQLDFIVFYFLVKKVSSRGTACFFLFLASILKCFNDGINQLSVEPLLILFMLLTMLVFACFYEICSKHYEHGVIVECLFGISGAMCGALAAFDIVGWVVAFTCMTILITETRFANKKRVEDNQTLYERMPLYTIYFVIMTVAIFCLMLFLFKDEQTTMLYSLKRYANQYFSNVDFELYGISYHESIVFGFLMCVLNTMWFFVYMPVPYDFARLGTLLWLGISILQYLHLNVYDYSYISSLFTVFLCVGGVYGIVYHEKNSSEFTGKRVIAFEDYQNSKEYRESQVEPDASLNGDEDWGQNFSDGRLLADESDVLVGVNPLEVVKEITMSNTENKVADKVEDNMEDEVEDKTGDKVEGEDEDEDEDEILDASELPIQAKDATLPAVIKIPEAVNVPVNQVLQLQIDNVQTNEKKQEIIKPSNYPNKDVLTLVTREEMPEKSETARIAKMPKIPVKQQKKRLQFTIEDVDDWDYDITDIPLDDDFDIK